MENVVILSHLDLRISELEFRFNELIAKSSSVHPVISLDMSSSLMWVTSKINSLFETPDLYVLDRIAIENLKIRTDRLIHLLAVETLKNKDNTHRYAFNTSIKIKEDNIHA